MEARGCTDRDTVMMAHANIVGIKALIMKSISLFLPKALPTTTKYTQGVDTLSLFFRKNAQIQL